MIYLDNASTSFHKPECVFEAVLKAMHQAGDSGRGSWFIKTESRFAAMPPLPPSRTRMSSYGSITPFF